MWTSHFTSLFGPKKKKTTTPSRKRHGQDKAKTDSEEGE